MLCSFFTFILTYENYKVLDFIRNIQTYIELSKIFQICKQYLVGKAYVFEFLIRLKIFFCTFLPSIFESGTEVDVKTFTVHFFISIGFIYRTFSVS